MSTKALVDYLIRGKDGLLGSVDDFYIDDNKWIIRYLVVDPTEDLRASPALIPSILMDYPGCRDQDQVLTTVLTRKQVSKSPDVVSSLPMTRWNEIKLSNYYGLAKDSRLVEAKSLSMEFVCEEKGSVFMSDWDPNLKSINKLYDFKINAKDGKVGKLNDFIVDTETWVLFNMVVETDECLLPARKILVSPAWIIKLDASQKSIDMGQSKRRIQNSPDFDPTAPVNRQDDTTLYDYYGRLNKLV
jgi:hypothetical protein